MKPLIIVILAFLLLGVALFGASYQLPVLIEVEQSIVLDARPEQVYPLLENPMEWENWSAVNKTVDPTMIRLYGGPMVGAGARMQWSGDKVGTGEVVFLESVKPKSLVYRQIENNSAATTNGVFTLEAVEGGNTRVFWKQSTTVKDEPISRLQGVWQKYNKEEELDKGLNGLQNLLQSRTSKPVPKGRVAARR